MTNNQRILPIEDSERTQHVMPKYRVPTLQDPPTTDGVLRRIAVVTNRSADSLEYLGLLQVFAETRFFLENAGRPPAYAVEVVTRGTGTIYECKGLAITASNTFESLLGKVDTLILQAADNHDECLRDERFIAWVAKMATRVRRIVSVCTGSFILAEAGVLDGRHATTHWAAADDFRSRYPNVRLVPDRIYVKDGHVYTSAGVTAGMDLAIALVEEDLGTELARRVAQAMVVFMKRPGSQMQFTASLAPDHCDEPRGDFERYIYDHLEGDLRLETLADHFGLSVRTFNRLFRKRVGMPPGRFVEQCRIERARQLLEETSEPVSRVAERSGYVTSNGLCLAFERNLGVTPRAYRRRFASSA